MTCWHFRYVISCLWINNTSERSEESCEHPRKRLVYAIKIFRFALNDR